MAPPCDDCKTLSVNPAVNKYPFSNKGRIRQRKEKDELRLSSAVCPRYSGTLTPTATTAVRLWETFTYIDVLYVSILSTYETRALQPHTRPPPPPPHKKDLDFVLKERVPKNFVLFITKSGLGALLFERVFQFAVFLKRYIFSRFFAVLIKPRRDQSCTINYWSMTGFFYCMTTAVGVYSQENKTLLI